MRRWKRTTTRNLRQEVLPRAATLEAWVTRSDLTSSSSGTAQRRACPHLLAPLKRRLSPNIKARFLRWQSQPQLGPACFTRSLPLKSAQLARKHRLRPCLEAKPKLPLRIKSPMMKNSSQSFSLWKSSKTRVDSRPWYLSRKRQVDLTSASFGKASLSCSLRS